MPTTNRTLVWFSSDAERRRRTAAAAQEELSRRAAVESGRVGLNDGSYAEIRRRAEAQRNAYLTALFRRGTAWLATLRRAAVWQPSEVFGCVALAGLALAMFEGPSVTPAGTRPCRTEPAVLALGADRDV